MSGPGFAPPDLCSIRAADEQDELAEAVRGGFSADGYPLGDDDPPAPLTSGIDRAIRLSTAVAVLAVAGIAAYVSYWHAYAVVRAHGETGITARLEPATIDGLVYASSMVVLYAARHRVPVPSLARWLLGAGDRGDPHGEHGPGLVPRPGRGGGRGLAGGQPGGLRMSSWSGSSARPGQQNTGRRPGTSATPRPAALRRVLPRPQPPAAEFPRRGERDTPDQARQPAAQVAGPPAIPASGQRDQAVPEAGAVNDAAVAAYRLSAQAGNPLSERKLAQMFGRTSRRWARARIAEARRAPSSGLTEDPAITVGAPSP